MATVCAKWNIQSILAGVSSTVSGAEGASKTSYVVISCLKLFTSCYCTTCEGCISLEIQWINKYFS